MMSMQYLLLLVLLSLLLVGEANADGDERSAILALMDQAFAAVGSGNPDDARATQLPEGTSLSFRPRRVARPVS